MLKVIAFSLILSSQLVYSQNLDSRRQNILKIIDEEIGKINKTLFNDVSVEEMKSLKQTMSKLQKCVEKEE